MQEYSSAELRSFKKYYTDLLMYICNSVELSSRLFFADLLSHYMIQVIWSLEEPIQQTVKLLDTVEIQISLNPQNFHKFVDVLAKDRPMQHLCDKLRSTCGECDNVCQSTSTDQWCSGVAKLKFTQPVSSVTLPPKTSGEQRMHVHVHVYSEIACTNQLQVTHLVYSQYPHLSHTAYGDYQILVHPLQLLINFTPQLQLIQPQLQPQAAYIYLHPLTCATLLKRPSLPPLNIPPLLPPYLPFSILAQNPHTFNLIFTSILTPLHLYLTPLYLDCPLLPSTLTVPYSPPPPPNSPPP